jgi:hypothetical protein
MFVALLAATALMAGSAAAAPAEPTAAPATQAAPAAADPKSQPKKSGGNKLVCRSEAVLGSRLPVKRCRTTEAIAQERAEDQRNLDKIQRRPDYGH